MARFGTIDTVYLDNSGNPLAGGLLYFYESGTSTLKNTYSNISETIANSNPVVLDAYGRQGNVYFSGAARVIIKTSAGVTIDDKDPLPGINAARDAFAEWSALITYDADDIVKASNGRYYLSIAGGNINNNPISATTYWMEARFLDVYNAGYTYKEGDVAIATDDNLYLSLVNSNLNNEPSVSPSEWKVLTAAGNVSGPGSSTDNAVVRFDGTGGTVIQNSVVIVGDTGSITGVENLTYSAQITSTVAIGTAPLVVTSTTNIPNLNASLLLGGTWASPVAIGTGTPAAGTFTTLTATGAFTSLGIDDNATVEVIELSGAGGSELGTWTKDAKWVDGGIAYFGAGNDLRIYHDGANSFISDQGTGVLRILSNQVEILNASGTENILLAAQDGAVTLYHDSSARLATSASGITLTGAALPNANDGGALGASGTAWSDLFLASGGVINWNAGNYTLTHSAGVLTASGAFTSLGAVGVGAAATDGTLHVIEGSAGAVTASTSGNIAVFEAASESGISVLGPNASAMYMMFGTPSNNAWALLQANYSGGNFDMISTKVGGVLSFKPDNQVTNLTLSGASGSQLAVFSGDVTLSEGKLSITDTANEVALGVTSSATTANAMTITADALTTGSALSISNTSGNTTAKYLLNVTHSAGGSSNAVPARFYTGSAGPILELEQDGGAGGAINFVGANLFAATAGAEEGTILIEIAGVAKVIKYFAVA